MRFSKAVFGALLPGALLLAWGPGEAGASETADPKKPAAAHATAPAVPAKGGKTAAAAAANKHPSASKPAPGGKAAAGAKPAGTTAAPAREPSKESAPRLVAAPKPAAPVRATTNSARRGTEAALDAPSLTTGSLGRAPVAAGDATVPLPTADDAAFATFVHGFWPLAHAKGITRATFARAFDGVEPDPRIAELTRKQAEFVKPIWSYLDGAASDQRIRRGREQAAQWSDTLAEVERRYGVDRDVVLGVWGMETNFGAFTGGKDVVRSLATLAAMGYRGTFFRDELVTALIILQQGHVAREDMKGSWAGAMGQTQFMPSSFMRFAVDADGDGHKDIWTSIPDALASTANYLHRNGWKPGLPWGFEVTLPEGFDWRLDKAEFGRWAAAGLRRADGRPMPAHGEASLFLPAGANGPVFLVTANFAVIKRYNNSDAYALGVAHLGDRIAGGAPIRGSWPTEDGPLARAERIELQERLSRLGYDVGDTDGRLTARTREALKAFQARRGLAPDGYAGQVALETLRTAR